jgi:hypothetical protein
MPEHWCELRCQKTMMRRVRIAEQVKRNPFFPIEPVILLLRNFFPKEGIPTLGKLRIGQVNAKRVAQGLEIPAGINLPALR